MATATVNEIHEDGDSTLHQKTSTTYGRPRIAHLTYFILRHERLRIQMDFLQRLAMAFYLRQKARIKLV